MNRRTFLKKLVSSVIGSLGLGGGIYYYAKQIEPSLLTVHRETISKANIPKAFHDFKIIQFSDTHLGFHYTLDQFKDLISTINENNPDIVVFTGDLVDMPNIYAWSDKLIELMSSIKAPSGKFWIYGNHDHGGYGTDIIKEAMDKANFTLLQNSHYTIKKENQSFVIAGLDDVMLGKPDIKQTINGITEEQFTILLVHEPDYADIVKDYPIDIQLSGHSHGGQIQIPFVGHVYTPAFAEKYVEGNYEIGSYPLQLFVSRGIGTTRLPYRFLCKPEITVYQLSNE
ncbi:metallophosphoesterase [Aquibacillus albus]|uniref:MPP superfamily phosphohydrolase n=1 Tax=Aquibacillus albus TaxID=1168171 RepID=A0ABS2N251_9BACI|nr:metallophosphoesterase [Aquibacillus albus]MBM7572209.1 putative MPP superfamily phosphohydrolase [Aquibacillus albus]